MENPAQERSVEAIQQKRIVDLDEVIRQKSDRVYNMMPRFILNWLKKIIHQDQLNYILTKYEHQEGIEFIESVLNEFGLRVETDGQWIGIQQKCCPYIRLEEWINSF
jgi:hypothetical protein